MSALKRLNELTPRQRAFTQWLAVPEDLRDPHNQRAYAKKAGVSEVTLSNWKRDLGLKELAGEIARDSLGEYLPGIYKALGTGAVAGELGKIKLALQLVGHIASEDSNGSVNVQVNVDNSGNREERFERLFAQLDAYRASADGHGSESDRGMSVDTNGSRA